LPYLRECIADDFFSVSAVAQDEARQTVQFGDRQFIQLSEGELFAVGDSLDQCAQF
jgi:hypothetical protein